MSRLIAFCVCSTVWVACSSVKVSSDYDKAAKFSTYKTYAFTKEAEQLAVTDINRNRVLQAVSNEMAKEGFTKGDQPDVWIDLKILTENKKSATATTTSPMYGPGYGYRMAPSFSTTSADVEHYVEGTLFVDMIDLSNRQLVWQGRAVGIIDPDASAEKREQKINSVMQKVFTKYPPAK